MAGFGKARFAAAALALSTAAAAGQTPAPPAAVATPTLAPAVELGQLWRVPTLTAGQRARLSSLIDKAPQKAPATPKEASPVTPEAEKIAGPDAVARAASAPSGPIAPEERLYFAVETANGVPAPLRAKLDAVFGAVLDDARRAAAENWRDDHGGGAGSKDEIAARRHARDDARNRRTRALMEVLNALLTKGQLVGAMAALPDSARYQSLQRDAVLAISTLSPEQTSRVRALYAEDDDQNTGDRARVKAIDAELGDKSLAADRRKSLQAERKQAADRLAAHATSSRAALLAVLTPAQRNEILAAPPGPRQPVALTPDNVRALGLPAEEAAAVDALARDFDRDTAGLRTEVNDLRAILAGTPPDSVEMATARAILGKRQTALDAARDGLARRVAALLTGEQLGDLVRRAAAPPPFKPS